LQARILKINYRLRHGDILPTRTVIPASIWPRLSLILHSTEQIKRLILTRTALMLRGKSTLPLQTFKFTRVREKHNKITTTLCPVYNASPELKFTFSQSGSNRGPKGTHSVFSIDSHINVHSLYQLF
jgi:hypothetical protein